jgi:hypothetical protein
MKTCHHLLILLSTAIALNAYAAPKVANGIITESTARGSHAMKSSIMNSKPVILQNVTAHFLTISDHTKTIIANADFKSYKVFDDYAQIVFYSVTPEQITFLSKIDEITHISKVHGTIRSSGDVTSQVVGALGIDEILTAPKGLSGAGVKIGIVSDSMARLNHIKGHNSTASTAAQQSPTTGYADYIMEYTPPQLTYELPEEIYIIQDSTENNGMTDEGEGMAEIIHDVAPGAEIYFHAAGQSLAETASAYNKLCSDGALRGRAVDIITDDISFLHSPVYQMGLIENEVKKCYEAGIPSFMAAGNRDLGPSFRFQYKNKQQYSARYDRNFNMHEFPDGNTYLEIHLDPYERIRVSLVWNEPYLSTQTLKNKPPKIDLDFSLNADANYMVASQFHRVQGYTVQDGTISSSDPNEFIQSPTYQSGVFYLRVYNNIKTENLAPGLTVDYANDAPLEFVIQSFVDVTPGGNPDGIIETSIPNNVSPIFGHQHISEAFSVGAANYWEAPNQLMAQGPTDEIDMAPYSSRGSLSLKRIYDLQGNFIVTQSDPSPAFSSLDGANTRYFRTGDSPVDSDSHPNFFGTSAAAPVVAAQTALLLEAQPGLSPATIRTMFECSAIDIKGAGSSAGWDSKSGAGLVTLSFPTVTLTESRSGNDLIIDASVSGRETGEISWSKGDSNFEYIKYNDTRIIIPNYRSGGEKNISLTATVVDECGFEGDATYEKIIFDDVTAPTINIYSKPTAPLALDITHEFGSNIGDYSEITSIVWRLVSTTGLASDVSIETNDGSLSLNFKSAGAWIFELSATDFYGNTSSELMTVLSYDPSVTIIPPTVPNVPSNPSVPNDNPTEIKSESSSSGGGAMFWLLILGGLITFRKKI